MQEMLFFTRFSPFFARTAFKSIYLKINGIKAHFFVRIGNMSIVNIMYSCMISCCAVQGRIEEKKKVLAFNNMHLIACRVGITEKIRLENLSEISKSNFAIKQGGTEMSEYRIGNGNGGCGVVGEPSQDVKSVEK